jgi:hypothetical protein
MMPSPTTQANHEVRSDFFDSYVGTLPRATVPRRVLAHLRDASIDLMLASSRKLRAIDKSVPPTPLSVLLVGIEVPSRAPDIHSVTLRLKNSSRHRIDCSIAPMKQGLGKFANITTAINTAPKDVTEYDWLVIVDDDIAFDRHMLDRLLAISEMTDLSLSQPAHRTRSFATYRVTRRQPWSLVRRTNFVEIGPVTAIHRRVFDLLLPFPESRWGFGIDALWSETLLSRGLGLGVVDASTIRHLRPVAGGYSIDAARAEGAALLDTIPVRQTRAEMLGIGKVMMPTHW